MPELPEVETIVRALQTGGRGGPSIIEHIIEKAALFWPRTLATPQWKDAESRLPGQQIQQVTRRGKYIQLKLEQGYLLIHLRMSGDIRVEPEAADRQKHDRFVLHLSDGLRLVFNDSRKFGRIWLVDDPQTILGKLGPEPLEAAFTPQWLFGALQRHRRQLKPLLLDQKFLAGLGNIYTDEALYRAQLHPRTLSNTISPTRAEQLWTAIRAVLEEGIRRNGASIDWIYKGGDFQNVFQVYQRTGKLCYTCGEPIIRESIGQRGTHYCPHCQVLASEKHTKE